MPGIEEYNATHGIQSGRKRVNRGISIQDEIRKVYRHQICQLSVRRGRIVSHSESEGFLIGKLDHHIESESFSIGKLDDHTNSEGFSMAISRDDSESKGRSHSTSRQKKNSGNSDKLFCY